MLLKDWNRRGKYFTYRGRSIFYTDEGEGRFLICIHGFPTSSWDWHLLWPSLIERFRVVAPDMIGFGFSDKPADYDYSIKDQASLHEELLQSLGVDRAHILAHDYGVSVAQELLARYEERKQAGAGGLEIESICFLNGGLFPETHRARLIQKLLLGPLGPIISKAISEKSFRRSFSAVFGERTKPSDNELSDFWSIVNYKDGVKISHKIIRYIIDRRENRERWVGAQQKTELPMRLINGPTDPISGAHMAERYRELIPNPDVVLLQGIGHYPQVEDPEGVLKAFWEFHDRLNRSRKERRV